MKALAQRLAGRLWACLAEKQLPKPDVAGFDWRAQNPVRYLRRHRRPVDQTTYEYWTLVESRRG